MKKRYILTLAILVAFSGASFADDAGTTTGEFLSVGAGARPTGMGEAFVALADDIHALYWNPAGLARIQAREALFTHTLWYNSMTHEYAAFALPLGAKAKDGVLGAGLTYLMSSFEKRTGDSISPDSTAGMTDMAISLSYARALFTGVYAGLTVKQVSSTLDGAGASALVYDGGLQATLPYLKKRITLGIAAANTGGSLKYVSRAVNIGSTLDYGFAVRNLFIKNFTAAFGMRTAANASSYNAGIEYTALPKNVKIYNYKNPNAWAVAPRAGYQSNGSRLSAGVGVYWNHYLFDYALTSDSDLGLANRFSLRLKF